MGAVMLTTERTPRSWDDRRPATKGLDGVWRAGRPLPARDLIVEADVQRDIKLALSPVCLLDERRAGLVTVESGATFTATTQGAADLHGVLPGGRHIEVECKHPRKRCKFQPGQEQWLQRVAQLGAVAIIARDVLDVLEALAAEGYELEAMAGRAPSRLVLVGLHPPPRRGLRDHRQRCRDALGRVSEALRTRP